MIRYLLGLTIAATPALSQESSEGGPTVYDNHGDLVLVEKDRTTQFVTPPSLMSAGRFVLHVEREEGPVKETPSPDAKKVPTLAEKIEARRIMYQANQAFFRGELEKTWELVEKAENLDPDFFRIKSMKGSLLYKIGSTDLAMELWRESLETNPDQPEIRRLLQETQKHAKAPTPTGEDVIR